jgi:hypothetical protein
MNQAKTSSQPTKLDNQTARQLIQNMMAIVERETTPEGLRESISKMKYGEEVLKNVPGDKFPRMELRLTTEEIGQLKDIGVLDADLKLSPTLAKGQLDGGKKMMTPLEKLLYSVLWKNGDLGKERHIVEGVYGNAQDQKSGIVFYEFGSYLQGRNNFIMDQHTLRCFAIAACDGSENQLNQARRFELINGKNDQHQSWMSAYKKFYERLEQRMPGSAAEAANYFYEVDRLFFGAGKLIKLTKKTTSMTLDA